MTRTIAVLSLQVVRGLHPQARLLRRGSRLLLFLVVTLLAAISASAQVQPGTPAFGSFGGGPDVLNLGSNNAHWGIPVLHKAGRGGFNFAYDLGYDTSVWYPVGVSGSQSWQPGGNWGWSGGPGGAGGGLTYNTTNYTCQFCNQYTCWYPVGQVQLTNWVYQDVWGARHGFSGTAVINTSGCPSQYGGPNSSGFTSTATDGSGLTLTVTGSSNSGTLTSVITNADGTGVNAPNAYSSGTSSFGTDRNGNQITTDTSGHFYDTLSSTTPVLTVSGSGTPSSPTTFTYTAPSGANASYTMKFTTYSLRSNFGCSGITEYGANGTTTANLVSEIDLPDGSKYTFGYEATPGHSGFVTGRLASVTLPTGGRISYSYSGGSNGIVCADGSAATLARTTPDGTWTYARSKVSGNHWQTTITDPNNNQTLIDFQQDSASASTNNFYEVQRKSYQGLTSGTLLRQWTTCYNGNTTSCATTAVSSPITKRYVNDQYGSSGLQCQHNYYYNSGGVLIEQDDYDYGSSTYGALLRKALISYASLPPNITAFQQSFTICNGTGSSSSCAGASGGNTGTVVAQTNFNYDETTPTATSGITQHTSVSGSRGNLTSINYPVSGLTSHWTYYDTGSVSTSKDVNGATTTYNYSSNTADCQMAFPTSMSEPLSMSRSMTWNCTGGLVTQVTDENGNNSSLTYNDPYFWRPSSATDQANVTTNICYAALTSSGCPSTPSATYVETYLNFNNNNSTVDTLTTLDGLGRVHVQQTRRGPYASNSNFDSVETDYDALGRVSRLTIPYTGTAGQTNSTAPATATTYDALSRVYQVKDGGNGTATFNYSPTSNDTLVAIGPAPSGENLKQRQLEYNSLGWLTSVCELTSGTTPWPGGTCSQSSSQTGYWTKYTFDALGNIVTVTQNAQSTGNQQTRSYTFDAMSRLTSETNPESGTTNYSYDVIPSGCANSGTSSAGDMTKKTDAAGHYVCPFYDTLHRVTDIGSDSNCKRFRYDNTNGVLGSKPTGVAVTNPYGGLVEAETDTCAWPITQSSIITDEWFSYTNRGETSDVYESTPHSGGYYHLTQSYWAHGALSQLSNLVGMPTISYGGTIGSTVGLDSEGRITQVTAASGQNPVTAVNYNGASLPTQVNFGSGDNDIFAYDSNTLRMTQYKFNVGSPAQSMVGNLTWNANGSLGQLAITDPFNSADTQTCNYAHDDLTRIAQVDCGTGGWGQAFGYVSGVNAGYDPFGNLTKGVLSNHTGNSFQPTYNSATNRFASIPGCSALNYDNDGNVLNDCVHNYAWDAYGNSTTVDTVGLTFDALDRMVEQNRSGSYTEVVYGPGGGKLGLMNGQTLNKAFIPLPGRATVVYTGSGLDHYRHSDWLGSTRLSSSTSHTFVSSAAYAPFGETYAASSGSPDVSFTGMNSDTTNGDYDFLAREYSNEGRWASPDLGGLGVVDPFNPQSWNRYAYVLNNPLSAIDLFGLNCVWDDGSYDASDDPVTGSQAGCEGQGGTWVPGVTGDWNPNPDQNLAAIVDYLNGGPAPPGLITVTTWGTPMSGSGYDASNSGTTVSGGLVPPNFGGGGGGGSGFLSTAGTALKKVGACAADHYGLTALAAGVGALGLPVSKATLGLGRGMAGASESTSVAGAIGFKLFGAAEPRIAMSLLGTTRVFGIIGRAAPFVSAALFAYDAAAIAVCTYKSYQNGPQ